MSSLPTIPAGNREAAARTDGRTVLLCLVGVLRGRRFRQCDRMTAAVTTFSGVETVNSYQAGVTFCAQEAAAEAQGHAIGGQRRSATETNGLTQVELSAQDRGQPLAGLEATVSLNHPNDRRLDRPVTMQASAPGRFRVLSRFTRAMGSRHRTYARRRTAVPLKERILLRTLVEGLEP